MSFIVNSVHRLLKERFGLPMGLADERVKILDPACGTGTFLAEVIRTICQETIDSGKRGILKNVIKDHILEDVYGFELLMAPYAMAHLKLSLLLAEEWKRQLQEGERLKIYLTNALEKKLVEPSYRLFEEALTRESRAAYQVKEETPILVVLGNPPYSVSSYNKSEFIEGLMNDYKEDVRGERNIQPLSDDYIKFIRFAQWKIDQGGKGIFSYISNNSYFSGLIHRGMRKKLIESFDEIYLLNLHGSTRIGETCPDGSRDENIFDIKQGNGIGIFVKLPQPAEKGEVKYYDLYGLREVKTRTLLENDIKSIQWEKLKPSEKFFFFIKRDLEKEKAYRKFSGIDKIFRIHTSGVKTHRDHFITDFNKNNLISRLNDFLNLRYSDDEISSLFNIKNTRDWKISEARKELKIDNEKIKNYAYKPYDNKLIYYDECLIDRGCSRMDLMSNFFLDNLGLILMRKPLTTYWDQVLLSKYIIDINFYKFQTYVFPLYIYKGKEQDKLYKEMAEREANLNPELIKALTRAYKSQPTPEEVLFYCYGVFHSDTYRRDYQEFLRIDFPRVPFTSDYRLFRQIAEVGEKLGRLHLLESPLLDKSEAEYPVEGDHLVEKPRYDPETQRLYINQTQYFGKVPPEVWEFVVGGYQVLRSYLRYRRGRNLSGAEVEHLLKVITAIKHTLRLMPEADRLFRRIDLRRLIVLNPR